MDFISVLGIDAVYIKQEMSLKKRQTAYDLKRGKITHGLVLVHKTYTDDRKLSMIIFQYQWTAILANFVRK